MCICVAAIMNTVNSVKNAKYLLEHRLDLLSSIRTQHLLEHGLWNLRHLLETDDCLRLGIYYRIYGRWCNVLFWL